METDLEQLKYPIGRFEAPAAYSDQLKKECTGILSALPSWMDACIENLDAAQLHTPYRPGGWTIQQVVHHVADSHMNAYVRFRLALTEDNPTILPYKEALWAELPDVESTPVNISVTLLHALHRRLVALMDAMTEADWNRTYHHPQYDKTFPLWEAMALYAWHSRHHTEHIRQLRLSMNW